MTMTTFEITIIVLLAAIVVLLIVLLRTAIEGFRGVWQKLDANWEQLRKIETHTNFLADISRQLDNIEDDILDDLRDIRIADKLGNTSPNVPTPLPCYSPDGICMNPHRDCINCPKRGTGGTWTTNTSIKAEDAPLQEWFNDNKED